MRAPLQLKDFLALILVAAFVLAASGTHVVSSGETLADIAADHGTTVRELVDANDLANPNLIRVGQELSIPGDAAGSSSSSSSPETYTVRDGDTLGGLALRFGTTVAALAGENDIGNPDFIRSGQQLAVPTAATSASAPSGGSSSSGGGNQLPGERHTVQAGETIDGIAAKYGISRSDFVAWNGLVDGKLYSTTRLALYNPGQPPASGSGGGSHTVQSGETLGGIASRHGTSVSAIADASGLANTNLIREGQELSIPGGGGILCPVGGSRFFNDWGFPRSGGRAHAGNDLFAARGTPVVAPESGHVDTAVGSIGGNQFRLTTSSGLVYLGSHMASFGETGSVSAGDVIGYVGDTGNARGASPHLHFEVHVDGTAVNPFPLLRSIC